MIHRSVCRSCHGGCGALVYVENGKVVKVKGDPDSPISRGYMCVKGLKAHEIANHPDRLKTPLKRIGERGQNKWTEISWDDALDEISGKVSELKSTFGPETIAIGQGTGRHHYMHVVRFANALGTPNWYEPGLAQCFIPRITVSHLTYGGFVVGDYYGSVKPKCILFWAHNPLVTSADGELAPAVMRALHGECETISVDPRRTETGKRCKLWLPLRPGTDAALALAMINHIMKQNLYDSDFIEQCTVGFSELKDHVSKYTTAWAQGITQVAAKDIEKAAEIYASVKPGILDWGLGLEQNSNSLQTVRAVAILRAITGNLDVPGGDILGMNILKNYPVLKDKLPAESSQKRIGAEEFKLLSGWRAYMPSAHIPGLFKAIDEGIPYRVRALLLFGNNPLLTVSNPKRTLSALRKLDLLVATDLFMTPSALQADYVLPAAFWPEINHLMGIPLVVENYVYAQRALTSYYSARQDEWIIDELSKRLSLPSQDMSYMDIFNHQLGNIGTGFEELAKKGSHCPPHEYYKYKTKGFRTPSKKVELYSSVLKRMGYAPLPDYVEPPESPVSTPELLNDYPYVLITGGRCREFFHSEHRQIKGLRERHPDPLVELHPETAKAAGVADGDRVTVSSPRGEIRMTAKVTVDIAPKVISVEHGWWFPEDISTASAPDEDSLFRSNANVLTSDTPPYDPAFGSYRLRGLLCSIKKT
ncbi:MAG: molybdopterin-dependent oxidoreductase [Nitrospirae bacterium]|nr:molybdopterin-dependent oxidoreductase [Nitrospirota bacterium]MBF0535747.1 molybdopterin-dependent oxidoreductase [Nitrospirota bacterium]MBF0615776.1 molybdopterin-dependent oxidoreductase [Nitrospirota bacterium]